MNEAELVVDRDRAEQALGTTYALQNTFIAVRTVGRYKKLFDSVLEDAVDPEFPSHP